jgi:hypothetical protein
VYNQNILSGKEQTLMSYKRNPKRPQLPERYELIKDVLSTLHSAEALLQQHETTEIRLVVENLKRILQKLEARENYWQEEIDEIFRN